VVRAEPPAAVVEKVEPPAQVAPEPPAPEPEPMPAHAPALPSRPPAPPPPPLNLARTSVALGQVVTSGGAISAATIRAGLRHSALEACYRDALRARGTPAAGTGVLELRIDVNGAVRFANVSGVSFLPAMKGCLERAARSARFKDIDTGEASAVVTLKFTAGP
jgi:hypothetical protein